MTHKLTIRTEKNEPWKILAMTIDDKIQKVYSVLGSCAQEYDEWDIYYDDRCSNSKEL